MSYPIFVYQRPLEPTGGRGWKVAPLLGAALLVAFAVIGAPVAALAAPGDLDPSFGSGGYVLLDASTGGADDADRPRAISVAPSGKIVIAGQQTLSGVAQAFVAQTTTNGALDPQFDGDGVLSVVSSGHPEVKSIYDVAVDSTGRSVLLGGPEAIGQQSLPYLWVARLTTSGAWDEEFDSVGGVPDLGFPGREAWGPEFFLAYHGLALTRDGNDSVRGAGGSGVCGNITGGVLPSLFSGGPGGVYWRTCVSRQGGSDFGLNAAGVLDDGSTVGFGGQTVLSPFTEDTWLMRVNSSGASEAWSQCPPGNSHPNSSSICRVTPPSGATVARSFAIDMAIEPRDPGSASDDRILVAAHINGGNSDDSPGRRPSVARILPSGVVDTTYDIDGWAEFQDVSATEIERIVALTVDSEGRALVLLEVPNESPAVVRLTIDGQRDSAFGTQGVKRLAFPTASVVLPRDITVQPDNYVVILVQIGSGESDIGVARLLADDASCGDGVIGEGEECDDGNTTAGDCCSATCTFEATGSSCGSASVTGCSNADTCDGAGVCETNDVASGTACPDDGSLCTSDICNGSGSCSHPAGNAAVECRAASDVCDAAESCDGTATPCPSDVKAGSGTSCGSSDDTACTDADTCDGAGVCETNDATPGTACPDDGSLCTTDICNTGGACTHPAGNAAVECRAASGVCDLAESCDGTATSCPSDAKLADGTLCNDGNACSAATVCTVGVCGGGSTTVCGPCESCTGAGGCAVTPREDCKLVTSDCASRLKLFDNVVDSRDRLDWEWRSGGRTTLAELDDPTNATTGSDYAVCMFGGTSGDRSLLLSAAVPPGDVDWRVLGAGGSRGFQWKDRSASAMGGLTKIELRPGSDGRASVRVQGKGDALVMPGESPGTQALPLEDEATLQLQASGGACWQATFKKDGGCPPLRNTSDLFYGFGDR